MIISASRRTDIPSFYAEWFLRRLKEGYVYVRNPMNSRQISEVRLNRDTVDCFVFWTKNPGPMLDRLGLLDAMDLLKYGIKKGKCIDDHLIKMITGRKPEVKKDRTQRASCGCVKSVDIGAYHTCSQAVSEEMRKSRCAVRYKIPR